VPHQVRKVPTRHESGRDTPGRGGHPTHAALGNLRCLAPRCTHALMRGAGRDLVFACSSPPRWPASPAKWAATFGALCRVYRSVRWAQSVGSAPPPQAIALPRNSTSAVRCSARPEDATPPSCSRFAPTADALAGPFAHERQLADQASLGLGLGVPFGFGPLVVVGVHLTCLLSWSAKRAPRARFARSSIRQARYAKER
jgi:hypothetical protein